LPVSYLKNTEKIATAKLLFYRIEKFPERQLMDVGESASDKNKDFFKPFAKRMILSEVGQPYGRIGLYVTWPESV